MDMLDNGQIVVSEADFILGNLEIGPENLSPQARVKFVREMVRLTVRRKDDYFWTLSDILSQDWSAYNVPSPKEAVRRFPYTQYFQERLWDWATAHNFLVLAHHKYFPIPCDSCCVIPETTVESEHLLLVRPAPKKEAEFARWAMTWEPQLDDPTNLASTTEIWSLPLHWGVVKHEFTILDDDALGEQLKKPHLSVLAYNSFAQDPVREIMRKVKEIDIVRCDRREASYRKDLKRSAQFTALMQRVGSS